MFQVSLIRFVVSLLSQKPIEWHTREEKLWFWIRSIKIKIKMNHFYLCECVSRMIITIIRMNFEKTSNCYVLIKSTWNKSNSVQHASMCICIGFLVCATLAFDLRCPSVRRNRLNLFMGFMFSRLFSFFPIYTGVIRYSYDKMCENEVVQ